MRVGGLIILLVVIGAFCISDAQAIINITYTVQTDVNRTPISPYVYGSNWGSDTDYTARRSGGNRMTAYNWENNYSNAGNDWYFSNDNYLVSGLPSGQQLIPGIAITTFQDQALSQNQASVVTLQMAGYVSADGNGDVNLTTETAPSVRFKKVVFAKGAPFCSPPGSPNVTDANVYIDEFVNFLVNKYGHAGEPNGVKFYDLDNEPDIWSSTHKEVHPAATGCAEYKNLSTAVSLAVKNVDPNAQILGPVSYGFTGYLQFQNAADWTSVKNGYSWFLDYYLDKMKADANTAGKRLLDGLDVHWYPEARDGTGDSDGNRIVDVPSVYSRANCNARMQAPRTLWDTTYTEVSWIAHWDRSYLPILPRLKLSINTYYPDTNLDITEYAYGGESHYSGGIATTDVLGIFGKYGVQLATYWGDGNYVNAAIRMYRKYDFRTNATFGDTNVPATLAGDVNTSIYASIFDSNNNELHLIVLNKNFDNDINGTFNITSTHNFTSGRIWAFDANGCDIREHTAISNITSNSFKYTVPKLSVCHIVLDGPPCPLQHELTGDCYIDIDDLNVLADQWLNPGLHCPGSNCADLNGDGSINFKDLAVLGQNWRQ